MHRSEFMLKVVERIGYFLPLAAAGNNLSVEEFLAGDIGTIDQAMGSVMYMFEQVTDRGLVLEKEGAKWSKADLELIGATAFVCLAVSILASDAR